MRTCSAARSPTIARKALRARDWRMIRQCKGSLPPRLRAEPAAKNVAPPNAGTPPRRCHMAVHRPLAHAAAASAFFFFFFPGSAPGLPAPSTAATLAFFWADAATSPLALPSAASSPDGTLFLFFLPAPSAGFAPLSADSSLLAAAFASLGIAVAVSATCWAHSANAPGVRASFGALRRYSCHARIKLISHLLVKGRALPSARWTV
mmetsp:Transcript_105098/g.322178  ORF Transcript_105098/g.322178 Transcript_105098/m.322178 type:complete len:206 (-) Transcript_105098:430-1047(-)